MKTLVLLLNLCITASAFAQNVITPAAPGVTYGNKISAEKSITINQLKGKLATDSIYKGKLTGRVMEVCKEKGCFLTIAQQNGEPVTVKFANYSFFVPQSLVGKSVVVSGTAKIKTTPVERLQHVAKDLGKSQEEIAKITEPKKEVQIVADGVLVVN
ncbi:DUF4920 domain-containing protein [Mucilaginibacter hurinus]|uniref:DUF4920 domain-containing protein n=1 Tax=Mucilaginibacter hurinus TaxID=2201324 RepID=A0A367GSI4_9SPHI|nr:DUF4920 domain-containing protein [Mucilaginibacter hurinus]RCH55796.1 DUF4920 domain-containing protein [Mucilaginibacter hurinus]